MIRKTALNNVYSALFFGIRDKTSSDDIKTNNSVYDALKNKFIANILIFSTVFLISIGTLARGNEDIVGTKKIANIVKAVGPSVVNIDTFVEKTLVRYKGYGDPLIDRLFGNISPDGGPLFEYNNVFPQKGTGSGVIIHEKGLVITNHHVVADSDKILIGFDPSLKVNAQIVATDPQSDLALLSFEPKDVGNYSYKAVKFGDLKSAEVGDWVIAIGNPFGLDTTVTVGVISAMERTLPLDKGRIIRGLIQTDAAINFGNSGGPLLDMNGNLIGINTAIIPNAQGIGFSVGIDRVESFIEQIRRFGKTQPPQLGVKIQGLNRQALAQLKIAGGALIVDITKNSPAERAGLKAGDIIISYGGEIISGADNFVAVVQGSRAGERVKIGIIRNGKKEEITAELLHFDQKTEKDTVWKYWKWDF